MDQLKTSLQKSHDTAVGPDEIHYQTISLVLSLVASDSDRLFLISTVGSISCRAGNAYPSRAHAFTSGFYRGCVTNYLGIVSSHCLV